MFGPEAKTRVWLVQDGEVLYVDRNANGDLTEPGEKAVAHEDSNAKDGEFQFAVGDIWDGNRTHKDLKVSIMKLQRLAAIDKRIRKLVAKQPGTRSYTISLDVEMPLHKGPGIDGRVPQITGFCDARGLLRFADESQDAPIIHFGGSWEVTLYTPQILTREREIDLFLGVGTPGLGPGTTAFVAYEGLIPAEAHARVEVTYPAVRDGEPPVRKRYELKQRC